MEGRLPRGFCIKRLTDLPMLWSELDRSKKPRERGLPQIALARAFDEYDGHALAPGGGELRGGDFPPGVKDIAGR